MYPSLAPSSFLFALVFVFLVRFGLVWLFHCAVVSPFASPQILTWPANIRFFCCCHLVACPELKFADNIEADPHRLATRQKQIDFGMNTLGYETYLEKVPK